MRNAPSLEEFSRVLDTSPNVIDGSLHHRAVADVCISRCRVDRPFSGQSTPDLAVVLISDGSCTFDHLDLGFGASRCVSRRGDFVVIPPNLPSSADGVGEFEQLSVAVPWITVARDIELFARRPVNDFGQMHSGLNRDGYVEQIVRFLWHHQTTGDESELHIESLVASLSVRLLQLSGQVTGSEPERTRLEQPVLRRVIDYIYNQADTLISLEQLAAVAQCSRFHFCRLFSATTGLSPNRYLIRTRVELAKARIKRGTSLVDAALNSGFCDQAHMTRAFKKVYGITPGEYRCQTVGMPGNPTG